MTTYGQDYQGRKRKYYSITPYGKEQLQFLNKEWLTYKETLDGIVEGRLTRTEYIAKLTKYLRKLPPKDHEEALEYFM